MANEILTPANDEEAEVTLEDKIDKLMNEISGRGCFTWFAYCAITFGMSATGFYFYILAYMTMLPKYTDCVFKDPQPKDPEDACNADNICSGEVISYEVDWDNIYSLHNWVEKLDLTCCPGWKIGLLGSSVFIGWFVTLPWVPRISDMYSRKWVFMSGMVFDWLLFIALFACNDINWMIFITFLFGLATTIRMNVGFVYLMELIPRRNQSFYASIYNAQEASQLFIATLYFWFVSKHWIYFTLIGFALSTWNVIAI